MHPSLGYWAVFQLPPSHEGEPALGTAVGVAVIFQLPPSHEGERVGVYLFGKFVQFQLPPSHEGEQLQRIRSKRRSSHFNSRPRMRANAPQDAQAPREGYFNSRPRMRANKIPASA